MKARIAEVKKEIVLSISMIVKNEEKYLGKCLSAITPLLNAVPSELIIVDTGSTDKTVEIAKKFTDKVFDFEWVNDFSAARNFGLEKCTGEWFMFLDADDIFDEDVSEAVNFFNNKGISSLYNSAYYVTRNYSKPGDSTHSDLLVQRIARRTPELCFKGKIHEGFDNVFLPSYYLKTFAHHYGYVYETREQEQSKKKRNLDLLFQELEEAPDNIRVLCQISDCLSPNPEAEQYITKAIELSKTAGTPFAYVKPYLGAINHYADSNFKKTVSYADEYIKIAKADEAHLIDAYAFKSMALFKLKKYNECIEAVDKYREYYKKFHADELDKSTMIYGVVHYVEENVLQYITGLAAVSHAKEKQFSEAYDYLEKAYNLKETAFVEALPAAQFREAIFAVTDITSIHADFDRLAQYYSAIIQTNDPDKIGLMDTALEKLYYDSPNREDFAKNASHASENGFFTLMKLSAQDNADGLQEFLDTTDKTRGYSEAVYLAAKHNANLSQYIKKINQEKIEQALSIISEKHEDYTKLMLGYCVPEAFTGTIKELYFAVTALEKAVLLSENLQKTEKTELYIRFTQLTAVYVTNIYNTDIFNDDDISVLPPLHRFGYYLAVGHNSLEDGDKLGYVRSLKAALKNCESMKDVISFILNDFLTKM
ncbi:MAG: glycosyltransferase family 2 protein [Oscillospiraceae bacterium]|nr:glycosyltransferase family 2 protein [Oscillospiraceae bacterium]